MIFVLLFLLVAMPFSTAHSSTWYVDNAAAGTGNGTSWANAWKSFPAIAWTSIKPGDTLFISGGSTSKVYNEQLAIGTSGTDSSPIYIKPGQSSPHNGVVTITSAGPGAGLYIDDKSHIVVDGNIGGKPHIRVTDCTVHGVQITDSSHGIVLTYLEVDNNGDAAGEHGIYARATTAVDGEALVWEISFCKIHDNWQDGIFLTQSGSRGPHRFGRFKIHDNEIYNISDDGFECGVRGVDFYNNRLHTLRIGKGSGHSDGIQQSAGSTRIYNNIFYNFSHPTKTGVNSYMLVGAQTFSYAIPEQDYYIYNNLIYDDIPTGELKEAIYLRGIQWTFGPGSSCTGVTNVIIANNTIIGTPFYGLWIQLYEGKLVENVQIYNNIVSNCYRLNPNNPAVTLGDNWNWTIGSDGDSRTLIFDHNVIYAGPSGSDKVGYKGTNYNYETFVTTTGTQKNISGKINPLLSKEYGLQSTSPVIDKARSMTSYFNTDAYGIARPQGNAWDVGASEYKTSTTATAPSPPHNLTY